MQICVYVDMRVYRYMHCLCMLLSIGTVPLNNCKYYSPPNDPDYLLLLFAAAMRKFPPGGIIMFLFLLLCFDFFYFNIINVFNLVSVSLLCL